MDADTGLEPKIGLYLSYATIWKSAKNRNALHDIVKGIGSLCWARTSDPLINRQTLSISNNMFINQLQPSKEIL